MFFKLLEGLSICSSKLSELSSAEVKVCASSADTTTCSTGFLPLVRFLSCSSKLFAAMRSLEAIEVEAEVEAERVRMSIAMRQCGQRRMYRKNSAASGSESSAIKVRA